MRGGLIGEIWNGSNSSEPSWWSSPSSSSSSKILKSKLPSRGIFLGENLSFQSLVSAWSQKESRSDLCGKGGIFLVDFEGDLRRGFEGLAGGVMNPASSAEKSGALLYTC